MDFVKLLAFQEAAECEPALRKSVAQKQRITYKRSSVQVRIKSGDPLERKPVKTRHERVTEALDLLTNGLYPYVEQELKSTYKDDWIRSARASFRQERTEILPHGDVVRWDAHAVLTVMWDQWNAVFRHKLGHMERSLISELREFRNRWAHQADFDFDDTYRVLDSVQRLLEAISALEAEQLAGDKDDLVCERFAEALDDQIRRAEFAGFIVACH